MGTGGNIKKVQKIMHPPSLSCFFISFYVPLYLVVVSGAVRRPRHEKGSQKDDEDFFLLNFVPSLESQGSCISVCLSGKEIWLKLFSL